MRLLGFARGIALCNFIVMQQFCLSEEVLFDVSWSFSSTTIVFPHDRAFRLSPIKVPSCSIVHLQAARRHQYQPAKTGA
jgi:hypothetical protein